MDRTITMHIPPPWLKGVPDEEATLQEIFRLGLQRYKTERALADYRDGNATLGRVAERHGLRKRELIREARARGIDPEFSDATVREESNR
ncbi:MAG: hypothetical protein A3K19_21195 [Lentisphaerae bacterium RIFOXYB12_FULL_65_16]|nr:MAG: hypothetical protein A3K18_33870 [Lentisphaerae bacterium RIFOXYA12_64_32]OGV93648.1 MAG: hypothetical protein A3K19_21195 [Lentisphaerae bacterium RIFOXYB12_FULL_65_16]